MFSPVDSNTVRAYGSADIVLDIWKQCPLIKSVEISRHALKAEIYEIVICVLCVQLPISCLPQITFVEFQPNLAEE